MTYQEMHNHESSAKQKSRRKVREIDGDLLVLAASDSDRDRQELMDRLVDMPPAELKLLRVALDRLDGALDALMLDRHLRRE